MENKYFNDILIISYYTLLIENCYLILLLNIIKFFDNDISVVFDLRKDAHCIEHTRYRDDLRTIESK